MKPSLALHLYALAGVAALLAEANPTLRGAALWSALTQAAKRLPIPSSDVGSGLVHV